MTRPVSPNAAGQTAASSDLDFALTRESGTWSLGEIAGWQGSAGLTPPRPVWTRTLPGGALRAARKEKHT